MTLITNYLNTIFIGALSISVNAANEKQHPQKNLRAHKRNLQGCSADNIQTASSVVVDGQMNEWDLSNDFHKIMYNGGELDTREPIFQRVGTAFFKYDCDASRLCVLALADNNLVLEPVGDGSNAWLKDYDINRFIREPLRQIDVHLNDEVVGWEACYILDPGCHEQMEVHAGWGETPETIGNKVASTGKISVDQSYVISLNLQCGPSTPAPSPVPSPGTVDEDSCSADDVSRCSQPDNFCSKAVCTDGKCDFAANNAGQVCRTIGGGCEAGTDCIEDTGCVEGYFCEGLECVVRYKAINTECSAFTVPDTMDAECTKGLCNNRGVCEPVAKVQESCGRENEFGLCDAGSICGPTGTCESRYKNTEFMCSPSRGCCDVAEYCTGVSYECPEDKKLPQGTSCRDACIFCVNDPYEACDGETNSCPTNIIMKETVGIYADEQHDAGSVTFTSTSIDESENYEFCATMTLQNGWELDLKGKESIDIFFSEEKSPSSNPRTYDYKYPDSSSSITMISSGIYKFCTEIAPSANVNFAIHLDVTKDSQRQSAWALPLSQSSESAFKTTHFYSNKGRQEGWGGYFTWESCNPSSCPNCTID